MHIKNIIFQVHCPALKLGKRSNIKEKPEYSHGWNAEEEPIYKCVSYPVLLAVSEGSSLS